MRKKILIVDDEENIRLSLRYILEDEGFETGECSTLTMARESIRREFYPVILLDVWMPDGDGIEFISRVKSESPDSVVVIMTGHGNIESAVKSIKLGAYDFLEKPFSSEKLLITVRHALKEAESRVVDFEQEGVSLIGVSPQINKVRELVRRVAKSKAPVLILGESGTGKELVARMIHRLSERSGQFVDVNCASIPDELVESELFGYEKGAFTGASSRKKGKFELADGGTLFLDEIGEMSVQSQAKLLRVLEIGSFTRLGGTQRIDVDVRTLAASNRDIKKEVERGNFRQDLYYRLSVFTIEIPPLRDRKEDIIPLAEYFLEKFAREYKKPRLYLSEEAKEILVNYDWKGNVRELKNLIERMVILADGEEISLEPSDMASYSKEGAYDYLFGIKELRSAKKEFEKKFIEYKLKLHGYDVRKTARDIGLDLSSLYRKIREYGIRIRDYTG